MMHLRLICILLIPAITACEADDLEPRKRGNGSQNFEEKEINATAEGPVTASLTGYPSDASPNHLINITVSGVSQYQWKSGGLSETDCNSSASYSPFESGGTISLDLSTRKESIETIKVCVIGKSSTGVQQEFPSQATWLWSAETPKRIADELITDQDNQVTLSLEAIAGNWLVIRSKEALNEMPQNGLVYKINDSIGNGTVIASGTVAELIDDTVKNEEEWHYSFFRTNPARRFSAIKEVPLTLAAQELIWVEKNDIEDSFVGIEPRGKGDKRYVCRARHTLNGVNRGKHPGRMFSNSDDLKEGACRYEFGGAITTTTNFELLMVNKGDPDNLVRWQRTSADETGTTLFDGVIIAGMEENAGENTNEPLVICRGYTNGNRNNVASFGKAGGHIPTGCRYFNGNNFTATVNPFLDILMLRQ